MKSIGRISIFAARLPIAFAAAMTVSSAVASAAFAAVSPFPYCYIDYDGLRSCSFRTLQECYQVRVGTGMCVSNPYYGTTQRGLRVR